MIVVPAGRSMLTTTRLCAGSKGFETAGRPLTPIITGITCVPFEIVLAVAADSACSGAGTTTKFRLSKASRGMVVFLSMQMRHFNPDSAIPRMKCFCVAKNRAIVGILVISEAPMITPWVPIFPAPEFFKFANATGSVAMS